MPDTVITKYVLVITHLLFTVTITTVMCGKEFGLAQRVVWPLLSPSGKKCVS